MVLGEEFDRVPAEEPSIPARERVYERVDVLSWVMARCGLEDVDGDRALADPHGHWEEVR